MPRKRTSTKGDRPVGVPNTTGLSTDAMLALAVLEEGLWYLQNLSESQQGAVIDRLASRIWDNGEAREGLAAALRRWAKEA